jgi:ferrous iron transport protein A
MLLYEGKIGNKYKIVNIEIDNKIKRRLEVIGLTNKTQIEILNKNMNGSIILKVRGTRFAISKEIAKGVEVQNG